jgi:hypothetical protein
LLLVGALAGGMTAGWVIHSRGGGKGSSVDFQKKIQPVLTQYCLGCHNDEKHKGDLSLQQFNSVGAVRQHHDVWAKVLTKVRGGEMPPEGKSQPSGPERERLVAWIDAELFPVDCEHPDPGRVTFHRLNRAEYNNTIRDLVGVEFQPAEDFPADDSGYGFDNIGDVLSVSPLLIEKYLTAAEKILDAAILDPRAVEPGRKRFAGSEFKCNSGGEMFGPHWFCLSSEGEAFVKYSLPAAGEYRFRVHAYGQQAGPEKAKMGLRIDGKQLQVAEVKAVEAAPGDYEYRGKLERGAHRFGAAFLNDYYQPNDPDPDNRDRNLFIQSFEIIGPLDAPPPPIPATQLRLITSQPGPGTTNQCLRTIVAQFMRRAFRRPPSEAELRSIIGLAEKALQDGASFEGSVKVALEATLVSPHFLFRGETQPAPNNPRVIRPIDEYALASRLSYFLWSSMPDEELFALADKGRLRKGLEGQARRMLRDPKSRALAQNFAGQWLQIRNLKLVTPDPKTFPAFDEELRAAMEQETELFFDHVLREDRNILEFITADYTFANERLARHYGLRGMTGKEFQQVSLAGTRRSGVLTHASVLTVTSNPTRTSPVKRGKWVLDNLLDQPPPPPLPNVPPLPESKEDTAAASLRQRMERHRQDPTCASCHAAMDPIGFGLENFDGIGAWREKDGAFTIDASGQLKGGEKFTGALELRQILAEKKRDDFVRCLAEKMLTYALGRGLEYYDRCAVERICKDVAKQDYRFSALVLAVVRSVPFEMRRGEGAAASQ